MSEAAWDLVLVGGGLANGLLAYRLATLRPALRVLILEAGPALGGNHTWSFHASDLTPDQQRWVAPFVAHRWDHCFVAFPAFERRVALPYCSATSERFAAVLAQAAVPVRCNAAVAAMTPCTAQMTNGAEIPAGAVIDGRGFAPTPHLRIAYQKFFGRELRLAAPHGLTGPTIMDATVAQDDGYRFVYLLPFGPDRVLIEDTYYADGDALDPAVLRGRVDAYAAARGWRVEAVEREESGVLPITLAGDIDAFWAALGDQPCVGLRAGLFNPVTGYSFADAVRLADLVAALPDLGAAAIRAAVEGWARRRWGAQRLFRGLNRMFFQAGRPEERWIMLRRFYRFPEDTMARFYAGTLTRGDEVRLLVGKPPVPIPGAVKALLDWGA